MMQFQHSCATELFTKLSTSNDGEFVHAHQYTQAEEYWRPIEYIRRIRFSIGVGPFFQVIIERDERIETSVKQNLLSSC